MNALHANGLVKHFEDRRAVDGIDLAVDAGEIRGLLGPNGAGKTTLLRMIFGLVRPDHGSIELFGRAMVDSDPAKLDGVAGFVEDPSFYPYLSGRANLEVLAELDGCGANNRVSGVLGMVGLEAHGDQRVGGYSTGMRQRLGVAAALLREPRLLLLDEPTSGQDPAGARDLLVLLRGLAEDGAAVLLSSHDMTEVGDVCDSFTILRSGRVVWDGTASRLRTEAPPSAHRLATSDDRRALEIARDHPGVSATDAPGGGLAVTVEPGDLDAYVLCLGRADVAIRGLEQTMTPLESMFFALTHDPDHRQARTGALPQDGAAVKDRAVS